MSTGSLGQGISAAAGMAKGAKYLHQDVNVYTLLGDGEIAEGEVWEAMLFAAHYKLDNFCMVIDLNGLQIDGRTCDVMNTAPVDEKAKAFGFQTISIDGHDFDQIEKAFEAFHACTGKPTCILMHTTKGKGVSFMENQVGWHGKAPNDDEYKQAMEELNAAMSRTGGSEMSEVKKIATRDSYGNALVELATERRGRSGRAGCAKLAAATKTGTFKKAFPERHFNCGIAECNMIGVAAGLSTMRPRSLCQQLCDVCRGQGFRADPQLRGLPAPERENRG